MNKKIISISMLIALAIGSLEISSCKKGDEDPFLSLRSRKSRITGDWNVISFNNSSTISGDESNSNGDQYEYEETRTISWDGASFSSSVTSTETGFEDDYTYNGEYTESLSGGVYSEDETYTEVSDFGNYISSYSFDGSYTSTFLNTYTFNDDGTFSAVLSMEISVEADAISDGTFYSKETTRIEDQTVQGTWSFLDGNEAQDYKNGERIALWYTTLNISTESLYDLTIDSYTSSNEDVFTDSYIGNGSEPDEVWDLIMLTNSEMKVSRTYSYDFEGSSKNRFVSTWISDNYSNSYVGTETGSTEMTLSQE